MRVIFSRSQRQQVDASQTLAELPPPRAGEGHLRRNLTHRCPAGTKLVRSGNPLLHLQRHGGGKMNPRDFLAAARLYLRRSGGQTGNRLSQWRAAWRQISHGRNNLSTDRPLLAPPSTFECAWRRGLHRRPTPGRSNRFPDRHAHLSSTIQIPGISSSF